MNCEAIFVNKDELDILLHMRREPDITQRQLAERMDISPAYVNAHMHSLRKSGLLSGKGRATVLSPKADEAIEKYRVRNAVILVHGNG